jgi:hypothetical protein
MRILINNEEYVIPSSISEITLLQRIEFQEKHGNLLAEMAQSIAQIEDELEREMEQMQFQYEVVFRTVSFFTGIDLDVLKESEFIDKIVEIYHVNMSGILTDENDLTPCAEFQWQGETWIIDPPELKNGHRMTFGEFIDSKQMIQNMVNLGKNKWECLLPLCAIFLRKKDEAYEEAFLHDNSPRLELMKTLPLDMALQVAFFLMSSLSLYTKTSQSFTPQE